MIIHDLPDGRRRLPDQAGRCVLVDDDPGVLETPSPFFRLAGFDVAVARTGVAAVDLARSRTFAACVCDLRKPDISGVDVLRQLRAADSSVPFILVSGYNTVGTKRSHRHRPDA